MLNLQNRSSNPSVSASFPSVGGPRHGLGGLEEDALKALDRLLAWEGFGGETSPIFFC